MVYKTALTKNQLDRCAEILGLPYCSTDFAPHALSSRMNRLPGRGGSPGVQAIGGPPRSALDTGASLAAAACVRPFATTHQCPGQRSASQPCSALRSAASPALVLPFRAPPSPVVWQQKFAGPCRRPTARSRGRPVDPAGNSAQALLRNGRN